MKYNTIRRYNCKSFEDNRKTMVSPSDIDYIKSSRGVVNQYKLADMFGITQGQISNIQRNKYHVKKEEW